MNRLLVLVLIILLSSCSAILLKKKTINPESIYKLEQVIIKSPSQSGWSLMQHQPYLTVFARNYGEKGESVIMNATMYKVGVFKTSKQFFKHIIKQRKMHNNDNRFKILTNKNKFLTFKNRPCLRYQTVSEDHKDKGISSKDFQYFKTRGIICRYPVDHVAFQIEMSLRSKEKNIPKVLIDLSEVFFKNIKFIK